MIAVPFDFVASPFRAMPPHSPATLVIIRLHTQPRISTHVLAAHRPLDSHLTLQNAVYGVSPKVVSIVIFAFQHWAE